MHYVKKDKSASVPMLERKLTYACAMFSNTEQRASDLVIFSWLGRHKNGTVTVPINAIYRSSMHQSALDNPLNLMAILVRLAGIEPTTLGFGGQYSIH